jgi:hypothetical protein
MNVVKISLLTATIFLVLATNAQGQTCAGTVEIGSGVALDAATKTTVIDRISQVIREKYLFPEQVGQIVNSITSKLEGGSYDHLVDADDFASTLTADLRAVSDDLHFGISIQPLTEDEPAPSCSAALSSPTSLQKTNFGFKAVKHLAGNVGYLEISKFVDATLGQSTAEASMQFLSNVDALIIDLRSSIGGYPSMAQLLAGYLLEPDTEMHRVYSGAEDTTEVVRAMKLHEGEPRLDLPLYILTSSATASMAEALAYDLKHLGRATIVGEKTLGAGHCAELVDIEFPEFTLEVELPVYKPIHPVTKSNWQGVGVEPDIAVRTSNALAEAHQSALQYLAANTSDPGESWLLEWASMAIKGEYQELELANDQLIEYAGTFGPRKITFRGSNLIYQRDGIPAAYRLVPLDTDMFALEGSDRLRLRYDRNGEGAIMALTGLYDQGNQDNHLKQR